MIFGVSVILIGAYAAFRAFEYFALKSAEDFVPARQRYLVPSAGTVQWNAIHAGVLLPARVAGWGALIWFALKTSLWTAVKLVLVAFPISLLFQATITFTLLQLGWAARIVCLVAVPVLAGFILVIIATI